MRDIPVFSTEYGIASLILKELPYRGEAYIRVQDTAFPKEFIEECVSFCRAVGAEKIYATGHAYLEKYPFHTAIWRMTCFVDNLPETDAALMPVTEETLEKWREIYNCKMADVANASYMSDADAQKMLRRGDGYFVHRGDLLLGIGIASGDTIQAVISTQPGAGQDVLIALSHALSADQIILEVASTNEKALRLYERMGFVKIAEVSQWYSIQLKYKGAGCRK